MIDSDRPPREARLAGALVGMVATSRRLDDPTLVGTLRLLESLRNNHRLVLSDVRSRWRDLPEASGRGPNALIRCVPLALWLRGPDHRLTAAALYLAGAQEEDMDVGFAAALLCHWLRALYRSRSRSIAWSRALDRTQASLADLGLEEADTAPFMSALGFGALAATHAIAHTLHSAQALLSEVECFPELAQRLDHPATPYALRVIAGTVGGVWFGMPNTDDWLGSLDPSHRIQEHQTAIVHRCLEMPRLERWPTQTSATHPLPIAGIHAGASGRIGLSPCPGLTGIRTSHGDIARDLGTDLDRISAWGAKHVLCLLRGDDLSDVGLGNYEEELRRRGIRLWHLPVVEEDTGTWFAAEWNRIQPLLVSALHQGQSIIIHRWDWDEVIQDLGAEMLFNAKGAPNPAQASSSVRAAVALAQTDASRLDMDQ